VTRHEPLLLRLCSISVQVKGHVRGAQSARLCLRAEQRPRPKAAGTCRCDNTFAKHLLLTEKGRCLLNCSARNSGSVPTVHYLFLRKTPVFPPADRLQVNFQEYIDELRHVYDLYHVTPDNLKNGARYPGNPQVVQDSTYLHDIEKATQEQDPLE
jgi:hypothetical protein